VAGIARLIENRAARLALLAVAVVLTHLLAIEVMWRTVANPSQLRTMVSPMFTRMLQPEEPALVAAAPTPPRPAKPRPKRPTVTTVPDATASRAVEPDQPPPQPVPESAPVPPPQETTDPAPVAETPQPGTTEAAANPGSPSQLQSWPADTRLTYSVTGTYRGPIEGKAQVQWQRENERYQVRTEISIALISLVMTSQGEIRPDGLWPSVYEETVFGGTRAVKIGAQSVTLHDGRSMPRPEGVQDTSSQFIELSHRFAVGQAQLQVPGLVSIWLARPGGMDLWTYDITGPEVLDTKFGPITAYRLVPRPLANPRGKNTAEIWFAPALLHLPVRIRLNMGDGNFADLMVDKIEQR